MLSSMPTLSYEGKTPLYEQLYRFFTVQIRRGALRTGEKLPSKRSLCAELGISLSTVETAYALLVSEGYVNAKAKSGYYVANFAPLAPVAAPRPLVRHAPETPVAPEIDLSTAAVDVSVFPYATWAKLNKEVVYGSPELLQRGDRQGDPALRLALASFLGEYRGVTCAPEQIVVGAGMEYLTQLLLFLLPKDTVFGVEDPGYPAFAQILRLQDRQIRYLPLDSEGLQPDALQSSDVSVAYVTPSHQFPMGMTMPASRRSQLLRWAWEADGRYLIEDDYDSEFRYDQRPLPAMQGMDHREKVIYVGTFSRSLAPSIRMAYLVLPYPLLRRYEALFGYQSSTVSRYEQAVMARFLQEGYYARYLRRVSGRYKARRNALVDALCRIEGVRLHGHQGGLHFLLEKDGISEAELCQRALEAGIALRGLSAYCHNAPALPSTVVVGYGGLRSDKVEQAARLLAAAWR